MAGENAVRAAGGKFKDLKVRIFSAVAVAAVALICIWLGGVFIAVLAAAAAGVMMAEWRKITAPGLERSVRAGAIYVFAVAWVPLVHPIQGWQIAVFGLLAMMLYGFVQDLRRGQRSAAVWGSIGALYIGLAALAFVMLRAVEPYGFLSIIWAVLVVIGADVGGYFAGRIIGGPKLWPAVSPKKTWAGLAGGIVLAFVLGGLFSWGTTGTYFYQVCAVSVVAAVLAQGGDLAESALKRHFGVKDAGTILPGHGGVLDRLDGHMVAVLVAAVVTFSRGQPVFIW